MLFLTASANAFPLGDRGPDVVCASRAEAQRLLSSRDQFITRLSPFDRSSRMKRSDDPGEKAFLAFVRSNVVEWAGEERTKMASRCREIGVKLGPIGSLLPKRIVLIQTTGAEEANAAYTRGQAIVLPQARVALGAEALNSLLCHEMFHVLSRANPKLRDALYGLIGFRRAPELRYPDSIAHRRITNPDAPVLSHVIRIDLNGAASWAFPVLFAEADRYDPVRGGEFFAYLQFRLLACAPPFAARAQTVVPDPPSLWKVEEVTGFHEQIGKNTGYIIHPEEILADNFVLMLNHATAAPNPEIIRAMERLFQNPPARSTSESKETARVLE